MVKKSADNGSPYGHQMQAAATLVSWVLDEPWIPPQLQKTDASRYLTPLMVHLCRCYYASKLPTKKQATHLMNLEHGKTSVRYIQLSEKLGLTRSIPSTRDMRKKYLCPTEKGLEQVELSLKAFMSLASDAVSLCDQAAIVDINASIKSVKYSALSDISHEYNSLAEKLDWVESTIWEEEQRKNRALTDESEDVIEFRMAAGRDQSLLEYYKDMSDIFPSNLELIEQISEIERMRPASVKRKLRPILE
jgi:hypothetical protein